jgi:hypothetical protein
MLSTNAKRLNFVPMTLCVASASRCTWLSAPGRAQAILPASVPNTADRWHEYETPCGHRRPGKPLEAATSFALVSVTGLGCGQVAASVLHAVVVRSGASCKDVLG